MLTTLAFDVLFAKARLIVTHSCRPAVAAVAHYAFHVNEAPNHESQRSRWLAKGQCGSLSMTSRALGLVSYAMEVTGRPCQPINRFQQISANLRATATRAIFTPERLRART